jgi:hypothetical protein
MGRRMRACPFGNKTAMALQLGRSAASTADQRARDEHRRLGIGEKLG